MSANAAWKEITAGTVGGVAICLVGHPFDTLKVRLQTQPTNPSTKTSLGTPDLGITLQNPTWKRLERKDLISWTARSQ